MKNNYLFGFKNRCSFKKIALAASVVVTTSLTSFGQMAFSLGPKAGYAVTSFQGDEGSFTAKTSWQAGLFMNWQLHPVFALQPEFLFSQKGAVQTSNNTRTDVRLRYFEVPVLLKLRLPIADVFFPHVLAGPNFAFNTSASYGVRDTQNGTDLTWNGGDITKTDVGGVVGLGFDVQAGMLFFTMDGRYGYGFNQLNGNTLRIRNVGWVFSAGVGIRFGGRND